MDEALVRLGMPVPDSVLARRAREQVAGGAPPWLVNHSIRSYAWATELARHDALDFDAEVLYVASMLHDIGLVPEFDLGGCYERDGAIEAERLALEHRQPVDRARAIYDAIDLHQLDETPPGSTAEVVLLNHATGVDVTGFRYDDVRPEVVGPIVAAYPRLDFKREFAAAFRDQAARKPACVGSEMLRTGILEEIVSAPFEG